MRLPPVEATKIIKILDLKGYKKIRQKGSHIQFKNDDGVLVTVPVHAGKPIGRGLLRKNFAGHGSEQGRVHGTS